jgi:PilZ domain-containing protein
VQMRESLTMTPDRRQAPRKKLVEIAYIGMGPENGGLVLDVSDGGLSFQAVAPVPPADTIQFLLTLRGHSRIEGAGEVAWANESRTVCGLRFTSLSDDAREQLNNWINQSRTPAALLEKAALSASPATPQTEESPASLRSKSHIEAEPVYAIPPVAEFYLSEPTGRSLWRTPLFYWITFGLLGTALTITAFIFGIHVGESEIGSVAQVAAVHDSQASSRIPEPATVPASPKVNDAPSVSASAPAVPSTANSVQSGESSVPNDGTSHLQGALVNASKTDSVPASSSLRPGDAGLGAKSPDQRAEGALEAGKSELAAALASLRGTNGIRDSSRAAKLLWAAVASGNSAAEVVLADLYLRGDGVAKSCAQGRVLLEAAAKSRNVQGQQKLGELNTNGCL